MLPLKREIIVIICKFAGYLRQNAVLDKSFRRYGRKETDRNTDDETVLCR